MKHYLRITDCSKEDIMGIFRMADELKQGNYTDILKGKTFIVFFPDSSIRTRITFEKGIRQLGGEVILFPSTALDKREERKDVAGYLNNWADCIIIRHQDLKLLEELAEYSRVPVINAMTASNHPCEILSDLYALSKREKDITELKYTFVGTAGNIANSWVEAAKVLELDLRQCCPSGYEIQGIPAFYDINEIIKNTDVVLTDPVPNHCLEAFKPYQITESLLKSAGRGIVLNPCPPFTRGEEVSADVIDSSYFAGYSFKKDLLYVQQALILYCMQPADRLAEVMYESLQPDIKT